MPPHAGQQRQRDFWPSEPFRVSACLKTLRSVERKNLRLEYGDCLKLKARTGP